MRFGSRRGSSRRLITLPAISPGGIQTTVLSTLCTPCFTLLQFPLQTSFIYPESGLTCPISRRQLYQLTNDFVRKLFLTKPSNDLEFPYKTTYKYYIKVEKSFITSVYMVLLKNFLKSVCLSTNSYRVHWALLNTHISNGVHKHKLFSGSSAGKVTIKIWEISKWVPIHVLDYEHVLVAFSR